MTRRACQQTVDEAVSLSSLANEVATTSHGMMSAIPEGSGRLVSHERT